LRSTQQKGTNMKDWETLKKEMEQSLKETELENERFELYVAPTFNSGLHNPAAENNKKQKPPARVKSNQRPMANRTKPIRPTARKIAETTEEILRRPTNLKPLQRLQQLNKEKEIAMKKYMELERLMDEEAKKI